MQLYLDDHLLEAEDGLLIGREAGKEKRKEICKHLDNLPVHTGLNISFKNIRTIDFSCADTIFNTVLGMIDAGVYPDKFIILSELQDHQIDTIDRTLKEASKVLFIKTNNRWSLIGDVKDNYNPIIEKILSVESISTRELTTVMHYNSVHIASNKLAALYRKGLVAREKWTRSERGGGRQFRYYSITKAKKK